MSRLLDRLLSRRQTKVRHNDRIFKVLGDTIDVAKAVVEEATAPPVAHSIFHDADFGDTLPVYSNPYPEELEHGGVNSEFVPGSKKRRSGRHRWGTGAVPYQHEPWFQGFGDPHKKAEEYDYCFNAFVNELRKTGNDGKPMTDAEIAKAMGISKAELKARNSESHNMLHRAQLHTVEDMLAEDPYLTKNEMARRTGWSDTHVGHLVKELSGQRTTRASKQKETNDLLKKRVDEVGFVDVSQGTAEWIDATSSRVGKATSYLEHEGYVKKEIRIKNPTNPDRDVRMTILAKPGETEESIRANLDKIKPIMDTPTYEGTVLGLEHKPLSVDSKRLQIRYAEDRGTDRDGLIELRRGVEDISLGNSIYAQVRIAVDDKSYLKGMAVYADDLPPGVDIRFNTNKHVGTPLHKDPNGGPGAESVLKPLKTKDKEDGSGKEIDWDNPFGATIKEGTEGENHQAKGGQRMYIGEDGKEHLSVINKVNDMGDWMDWDSNDTLATQMLSKQPLKVAEKQMKVTMDVARSKLDELLGLENPVLKQEFLMDFADKCERDAVDMKTIGIPRQSARVILPLPELNENEIYAPGYHDGDNVILVRYPHEGTFQIPSLTVNNKNVKGRSMIGAAPDAVGIHPKAAVQLSGADFDGDTVLVIPNDGSLVAKKAIRDLVEFDAKERYPYRDGIKLMTKRGTGDHMGKISNLITDMTLNNASIDKVVRAVKYANTVIDAYKHHLDWQLAYKELKIDDLEREFQPGRRSSTLISKAKGEHTILDREEGRKIIDPRTGKEKKWLFDLETGDRLYTETGKTIKQKDKKVVDPETGEVTWEKRDGRTPKKIKVSNMSFAKDARELSSGLDIENAYADFANFYKDLAREARKATLSISIPKKDPVAAKTYAAEVASLNAKIAIARKRAPLERQAQRYATLQIEAKLRSRPELRRSENEDELKRMKSQAMAAARYRFTGKRKRDPFDITDKEWEAIQANAIAPDRLREIKKYSDEGALKAHALPKKGLSLTKSQISTIKAMANRSGSGMGYTQEEIADALGVSPATVSKVLLGKIV